MVKIKKHKIIALVMGILMMLMTLSLTNVFYSMADESREECIIATAQDADYEKEISEEVIDDTTIDEEVHDDGIPVEEILDDEIFPTMASSNRYDTSYFGEKTLNVGGKLWYGPNNSCNTNYMSVDNEGVNNAYCIDPRSTTPADNSVCRTYVVTDSTIRKLLYYSAGAPGWNGSNGSTVRGHLNNTVGKSGTDESIYMTHMALGLYTYDDIGMSNETWRTIVRNYLNAVKQMPAPPANFSTFYLVDGESDTQGVMMWKTTPNTGSVEVVKVVNDYGERESNIDLSGIVFELYATANTGHTVNHKGSHVASFTTRADGTTYVSYVNSSYADVDSNINQSILTGLTLGDYALFENVSGWNGNSISKFHTVSLVPGNDQTQKVNYSLISSTAGVEDGRKTMGWNAPAGQSSMDKTWDINGVPQYYISITIEDKSNLKKQIIARNWVDETDLKLHKKSTTQAISSRYGFYNIEGAIYAVYDKNNLQSAQAAKSDDYASLAGYCGSLKTDENGNTETLRLLSGIYYIKEVVTPKGYYLDGNVYTADLTDKSKLVNNTFTLEVSDKPKLSPVEVLVNKKGTNGTGVKDAQYTVKFFEGEYAEGVNPESELGVSPDKTWVLKTDENGQIKAVDYYKISGDNWYELDEVGTALFPVGTMTIQETKSPENYHLDNKIYVKQIRYSSEINEVLSLEALEITEQPEAKVKLIKTSKYPENTLGNKYSLAGAVYAVYTSEKSAKEADKDNYQEKTGYVGCLKTEEDGQSNVLSDLYAGIYYIKEIKAPENFRMDSTVYTANLTEPTLYEDNTYILSVEDYPEIEIKTKAWDINTEDNLAVLGEDVSIVDAVYMSSLLVGKMYTLKGELVVKTQDGYTPLLIDGKPVLSEKKFEASFVNSAINMGFPAFDATALKGQTIVVFERLYEGDDLVAEHCDADSEEQSIHFAEINTTAYGTVISYDNSTENPEGSSIQVVDKVFYKNLIPGYEYVISGMLMNKNTNTIIKNKDGMPITSKCSFCPEKESGMTEVIFDIDKDIFDINGDAIVVFENLELNGKTICSHADINDISQTVLFPVVSKVDSETKEMLSGAKLAIYNEDGDIIESWITDGSLHVLKPLENGMYRLVEEEAPEGYELVDDIEFKVSNETTNIYLEMEDIPIKGTAKIIKVDSIDTTIHLDDVEFDLYKDDIKYGTFKTDINGVIFVEALPVGNYYFVETKTKDNYILSNEKVCFSISPDNRSFEVTVKNAAKIGYLDYSVETKNTPEDTPPETLVKSAYVEKKSNESVKTGDNVKLVLVIVIMIGSVLGLLFIGKLKRKRYMNLILAVGLVSAFLLNNTAFAKQYRTAPQISYTSLMPSTQQGITDEKGVTLYATFVDAECEYFRFENEVYKYPGDNLSLIEDIIVRIIRGSGYDSYSNLQYGYSELLRDSEGICYQNIYITFDEE